MAKSIYTYFICILFCTLSFSSDYGTLYLMEFENSSYDYRTDNLRTLFPELIKENYSNKDFSIGYAPNLLNNKNTCFLGGCSCFISREKCCSVSISDKNA